MYFDVKSPISHIFIYPKQVGIGKKVTIKENDSFFVSFWVWAHPGVFLCNAFSVHCH